MNITVMRKSDLKKPFVAVLLITAALLAAVIFHLMRTLVVPVLFLPSYSEPVDKTVTEKSEGIRIVENKRVLFVFYDDEKIWELPDSVRAQDFFYEDIDRDGRKDMVILCWKRGRYGEHKPTWVKRDEIKWSQHIYIFGIEDGTVRPKWMASDIGMQAACMEYADGAVVITDTKGEVTKWIWRSWGLEKM